MCEDVGGSVCVCVYVTWYVIKSITEVGNVTSFTYMYQQSTPIQYSVAHCYTYIYIVVIY